MIAAEGAQGRARQVTTRFGEGTARGEAAPGGHLLRQRHVAGNGSQRAAARGQAGNRSHQADGVRVLRIVENRLYAAGFHYLSGVHHRHALRHFGHHA